MPRTPGSRITIFSRQPVTRGPGRSFVSACARACGALGLLLGANARHVRCRADERVLDGAPWRWSRQWGERQLPGRGAVGQGGAGAILLVWAGAGFY